MKANNCYFLNKEETEKLSEIHVIGPQQRAVNGPLSWANLPTGSPSRPA